MDVYEALYTTRAMRRCGPDPIPMDAQQRILDAAIRAPSGGNTQNWRFMLVDPTGGSIFPATWSAMLAARAEGIGSSLTSVFMFQIDKVLEILGVPKEGG